MADEARTELVLREMRSEWMDRVMERIAAHARPAGALAGAPAPATA